jgi:hypothetical protein
MGRDEENDDERKESRTMNARRKLNNAAVTGAIVFGGLLGFATGSWIVAGLVAAGVIIMEFYDRTIR